MTFEDTQAVAERRTALRALLMQPLLTDERSPDDLLLVRRHREHLVRLCAEGLGYRLVVEPKAARLYKGGLGRDANRPLRKPVNRGRGRRFEPRAYALLCLTLAALTRCPGQLLLDELVAQVRSAVAEAHLDIDLDKVADRRAMAAALAVLIELGVLIERDGDLNRWVEESTAQSLLDVRRDRLTLLAAAGLSRASGPEDLLDAAALPSAAGGARVAVRRRLLESPVLSSTDLTEDQAEWWRRNRNREAEWFREHVGLDLELRAEGAMAIDPDETLTDLVFPGTGSARHAALLVLERLVSQLREDARSAELPERVWRPVPQGAFDQAVREVGTEHARGLRKVYADVELLAADVLEVLTESGLLRRAADGLAVHAAAARYAPQTTYAEGLF
ncbi:MAG: TIGR02678 family protein [Pseudonocardiales bacterium]|nr:MAG: TIGR02678 family protein [Pseudonocardiales bacterium]